MANIVELSILIIGLAVAGFIFRETFYLPRKFCTPYVDNSTGDKTFSYISIAVLIIGACWIAIIYSGSYNVELITQFLKEFLNGFQILVDEGVVSETEIIGYIEKALLH